MSRFALLLLTLALAACAPAKPAAVSNRSFNDSPPDATWWNRWSPTPGDNSSHTGMIQGQARVISVDPILGQALLESAGQRFYGFWQVDSALPVHADSTDISRTGPLNAPTAAYHEPVSLQQAFPANPGDTIAFVGFKSGNDVFLRGIQVIGR